MKKTVIVADDEPIIRMDLRQMLEELDYEVVAEAVDGYDAVEFCRKKKPDIVLLDLEMPIFDGMTAAETIFSEGLAGCIVICTAFADEEFVERAGQAGAAGYLVKPIEQRMLRPSLEVAYAQGKRLDELHKIAKESARKLQESRVIERAKGLLAQERSISETDAYREMQQLAMRKRTTILTIAQAVLDQNTNSDAVGRAKMQLMHEKQISENAAYKLLLQNARKKEISVIDEAKSVLARRGLK